MSSMGVSSNRMPPENLQETHVDEPVHGNGNGNGNHNGGDSELEQLIELAESRQVPALLRAADATHTIAGADGPRWRFQGEGTPEGDEILLRAVRNAIKQIDAKRERDSTNEAGGGG
jgi:nucleotide-binding universal stress UspA family protein